MSKVWLMKKPILHVKKCIGKKLLCLCPSTNWQKGLQWEASFLLCCPGQPAERMRNEAAVVFRLEITTLLLLLLLPPPLTPSLLSLSLSLRAWGAWPSVLPWLLINNFWISTTRRERTLACAFALVYACVWVGPIKKPSGRFPEITEPAITTNYQFPRLMNSKSWPLFAGLLALFVLTQTLWTKLNQSVN